MSDGWIEWKGGECPVHPDTVVAAEFRDGSRTSPTSADLWDWRHHSGDADAEIVRYRIVRPPLDFHTSGAPVRADDVQQGGDHYRTMEVQPWAAMQAWMTPEQFRGFLLGSAIAYLGRFNADAPGKGGITDIRKARHVLDKLAEVLETQNGREPAQEGHA